MWRWILVTALVVTCSIGTSLIGNGFTVGMVGFWPSLIAIFLSWAYLLITALYFLEATLARPPGANIFSMSRHYFGPITAWIVSIIWLFLLLGALIGFFELTPPLIMSILAHHEITISPHWIAAFLFIVAGGIFSGGVRLTMAVNLALFALMGLILYQSYHLGFAQFSTHYFKVVKWEFMILVFPVVVTSLYYHFLIPTISSFLNNNIKQIRSCIVSGSLISASIFAVWCIAIASAADQFGPENLAKVRFEFLNYEELSQVPILGAWMPSLSLICMMTAVLNVGLIITDFFGDLFGYPFKERKGVKRIGLVALALIPTYLLSVVPIEYTFNPILYLSDFAGLFITGLLPILWVWSLRHSLQEHSAHYMPGGNATLVLMTGLACFMFYLLGIQIIYQTSM